jgi:hypothetical protein
MYAAPSGEETLEELFAGSGKMNVLDVMLSEWHAGKSKQ